MKNYKYLVPVILILALGASVYMTYDRNATQKREYEENLTDARDCRSMGVWVDAEQYYMAALERSPSLELYVEIGTLYVESEQLRRAIDWGEDIMELYPKEAEGYEFLMDIYYNAQNYVACFQLLDTFEDLGLKSSKIEEQKADILYTYDFKGEYEDVGIFSSGYCPVELEGKWGYVNEKGSKKVSLRYLEAGAFSSAGVAAVIDAEGDPYYIDSEGNKKLAVQNVDQIEGLGLYVDDIFPLYDGEEWGFYNIQGDLQFGGYEAVSAIGNGMAAVKQNGRWQIIDDSGTPVGEETYDDVVMDEKNIMYRNERIFVEQDYQYFMLDGTGQQIGDTSYEGADVFRGDGYAAVKIDGKWGFVDVDGNVVIEPQYEEARSFSNGYAAVRYAGEWGYIDSNGNVVIDTQFEDARDFSENGSAFVCREGVWELLLLFQYNH